MGLPRRIRRIVTLAAVVIASATGLAEAQEQPDNDGERQEALRLYQEHKMAEAAALLEKVAARRPNDTVVHEALGNALLLRAETQPDLARA